MVTFEKPIKLGDIEVFGATEFASNDVFGTFENNEIPSSEIDWSDTTHTKKICDAIKNTLNDLELDYLNDKK